jgi:murein DD-endopeptidase MepM/ murein hydrolase activator NlpD
METEGHDRMMRISVFAFILLLVYTAVPFSTSADAFRITTEPQTVGPGDPFLIRITGLSNAHHPAAFFGGRKLMFVPCGEDCSVAVCAADLELKPGKYRIAVSEGMKKRRATITVRRHIPTVIRITLPADKVTLSPDDIQRVEREDNLLKALWIKQADKMWDGSFQLPLQNDVSTQFGVKRIINDRKESFHKGIDIRGRAGEEVRASNSGTVVLAAELYFGGNTLVISHGMGVFTVYMHLDSFGTNTGKDVSKGDIIGFVGSTGRSTGPHLHFGVKVQDVSVNPVAFTKLKL